MKTRWMSLSIVAVLILATIITSAFAENASLVNSSNDEQDYNEAESVTIDSNDTENSLASADVDDFEQDDITCQIETVEEAPKEVEYSIPNEEICSGLNDDMAGENNAVISNNTYMLFPKKLVLGVKETCILDASEVLTGSKKITYTSSNRKVASINKLTGQVKAKKPGTTKITAKQGTKKIKCKITVRKAPTSITVFPKNLSMMLGEERVLSVALPKGTASQLYFESSDEDVVSVDEAGVLYAEGVGTAMITVRTYNKKKEYCKVTVSESVIPNDFVVRDGVIISYVGKGGAVILPEEDVDGQRITAVGASAFAGETSITSVFIPSAIRTIGEYAFEGCSNLTTVSMTNNTVNIERGAFRYCTRLVLVSANS